MNRSLSQTLVRRVRKIHADVSCIGGVRNARMARASAREKLTKRTFALWLHQSFLGAGVRPGPGSIGGHIVQRVHGSDRDGGGQSALRRVRWWRGLSPRG